MEKWIQKLSGAVIASVLALTLSTKASADLMEDDPNPDQPLPQYEENTGEDTPAPSRGAPASDDEDGEDGKGEGDDSADPDEAGVITLSNIEDPADVTEFTPGEDDSVDLSSQTTDNPYDLFGFDAGEKSNDPDDDCFYMVDFDGSDYDLTSTDSDINIKAAGLNRLHGIYADGDVNLTGSGILLVDDIQLSEGCGFYLHPIAGLYDSGSVAVFRLQTPADTAGGANAVYELINGKDVPGILDEAYTVPDGVTLVIPANSSLILESLVQVTTKLHYDENDELVPASVITYPSESHPQFEFGSNYDYDFSTANLTIPESAGLVLEDGASMTSHTIPALSGKVVRPKVTVSGTLEGTGIISGGCFEFNGHASVDAAFQGGLMYNTALLYNNAQNIKLTITDSCSLISSAGSSISRIVLAPDASLECYVREGYPGSGILGGSGAGSITGGAGSSIFTGSGITNNSGSSDDDENSNDDDSNNDHAPVVNPQPGAQQNVVVTVTSNDDTAGQQAASLEELDTVYTVSASVEGHTVAELTGMVTVRFSCPAPETNVMIFAVFRDSNSSLKVFRARYDRITGQLVFECDMLGDFAVVCVDYKGDLTSDEFYALLESFDSVNKLH